MTSANKSVEQFQSRQETANKSLIIFLFFNGFNSLILFGLLPPLIPYIILPYGQKAFYYSTLIYSLAYPLALLFSVMKGTISLAGTIIGSIIGCLLAVFMIIIASQSPCPWWADTIHGALIMISIYMCCTVIIAYVRITIGNRLKNEWANEKGLFYFGVTVQLGSLIGTIPIYLLINVFHVFIDRKPCQIYCQK